MVFNGYWMLSNRQIFDNAFSYVDQKMDIMESGHLVAWQVDWAAPAFIVAIASLLILIITKVFREKLAEWGFSLQRVEIEVDENLPNFFNSIKLSQADEIVLEEQ